MRPPGARLVEVPGPRRPAPGALQQALEPGGIYASHGYPPFARLGLATAAWAIWEPLGRAPDAGIPPLGHGMLSLGLFLGFEALYAAGYIERLPRLYGVPAVAGAPLARASAAGLASPIPVGEGETIADPPRGREIRRAARATGGAILAVSDPEIQAAQAALARRGRFGEPTGAMAMAAGSEAARPTDRFIGLMLTGSG